MGKTRRIKREAAGKARPNEKPVGPDDLKPWAARCGRYNPQDRDERRTEFKHDEDEIVHSAAFRRLSNKSQVVVRPKHRDHFRSRLTHTLEVNQIAESIGLGLGLNRSLIHAIALGHDVGHCAFGHAGEYELQQIVRAEILGDLCDQQKLAGALGKAYSDRETPLVRDGKPVNSHLLFHHAINSVRVIERKMKDVTERTKEGIKKHSWSPWQDPDQIKFGIPMTYEAQAVAIADQVAGINHDTEDILNCPESEYDKPRIEDQLFEFMQSNGYMNQADATKMFHQWFLMDGASRANGWARKLRLRKIINSVVESSLKHLTKAKVDTPEAARLAEHALKLDKRVADFLRGYEQYLRRRIIQSVPWFKSRDAIAAAVVRNAYSILRCYRSPEKVPADAGLPNDLVQRIRRVVDAFKKSADDESSRYLKDSHYAIFFSCAKPGKEDDVRHAFEALDYVSGMTDNYIMDVHEIAFEIFR